MDKDIDELNILDITEDMIKNDDIPSLYSDNVIHLPKQIEVISQPTTTPDCIIKNENKTNAAVNSITKVNDYGVVFNDDIIIQKNMSIIEILEKVIKDKGLTIDDVKRDIVTWCIENEMLTGVDYSTLRDGFSDILYRRT